MDTMTPLNPIIRARKPDELATLAFAGVITEALRCGRQPLIRGLSEARFQKLLNEFFFGIALTNGTPAPAPNDEFDDLVELLLEHRAEPSEPEAWLAYAVASAAMGENHLWQDMGLPSRKELSELMREHFPALAAMNSRDMKWKKFFYRQLCGRAGVPICKSPHCAECCDYAICFGPEDA
jgi:nitrogen fixation protein NifQ